MDSRSFWMIQKKEISVETLGGIIFSKLEINGEVTVNMGTPKFEPEKIPFIADKRMLTYLLEVNEKQIEFSILSMGNQALKEHLESLDL